MSEPVKTFRSRLKQRYRKYRATLILTNGISREERQRIDESLENIDLVSGVELRKRARELKPRFEEVKKHYGVRASLAGVYREGGSGRR